MMITNNSQAPLLTAIILASCSLSLGVTASEKQSDYKGSASITQGLAATVEANLFECKNGRSRVAGVGEIIDSEGKVWTVPAENQFGSATKAVDLYEECANITPKSIAEVDENLVPVVVIDADGQEVTAIYSPTTTLSYTSMANSLR